MSYLTLLGMKKGENEYTYPPYTEQQAAELLDGLRALVPYVVVDCGSYIANDILSAVALMESDSVLRLANCDLKSVSYFSSQLPLLKDTRWDADKQYKVVSNVKPQQAAEHIGKVLGSVAFKLPYSQELEEQYLAGTLLSDLTMKDSCPYRKELDRIFEGGVRMLGQKRNASLFTVPEAPESFPHRKNILSQSQTRRRSQSLSPAIMPSLPKKMRPRPGESHIVTGRAHSFDFHPGG